MKGFVAPEVERAYTRTRELCQQLGNTPHLFLALQEMWWYAHIAGTLQTAQELVEQLLQLAQSPPDPAHLLVAHLALATTVRVGSWGWPTRPAQQGRSLSPPQQHGGKAQQCSRNLSIGKASKVRGVELVGDEDGDRTESGLWPLDHAGVVGKLELPQR
jgi:hypothetical protein